MRSKRLFEKRQRIGDFLRGGNGRGGEFHTPVRGTRFVRNGAVTPGPSRECDITFFVKGRPKSARQSRDSTVAARRVQSVTVPSSRVSRECQSPGLRSPPFRNARKEVYSFPLFTTEFCEMYIEEMDSFNASKLPVRRLNDPQTSRKHCDCVGQLQNSGRHREGRREGGPTSGPPHWHRVLKNPPPLLKKPPSRFWGSCPLLFPLLNPSS